MDETLLSRIEDAGLNASAPPQQRWLDGWLLRCSPGKAKRARCINALAAGRMALDRRLQMAEAVYAAAGLPVLLRITPFTQPPRLDAELAARGWSLLDDTRVMVRIHLSAAAMPALPEQLIWETLGAGAFAAAVGGLRGSPPDQPQAHAERLAALPVPCRGYAISRRDDGSVLACGQFVAEAELVGLYDIHTHPQARRQGLASLMCERLLSISAQEGAAVAYLQVDSDNAAARSIYHRLRFADAYGYHYRAAPGA